MTDIQPPGHSELNAWAADHGTVYQSTESMIVVHGDMTQHFYSDNHPDGEKDERTTALAAGQDVYPGLRAFGRSDAQWFHGREKLVSELLSRLDQSLAAEATDHSPVAVVAPSGAGKSSLLRAGLLPELGKGQLPGSQHWPQLLLTPTAAPLAALATGLALLTKAPESDVEESLRSGPDSVVRLVRERLALPRGGRLLLVVDQLEELFTLCQDESARHRFVAVLAALTGNSADSRTSTAISTFTSTSTFTSPVALTVYGLRADVYGSCAAHPHLRNALVNRQVIVGPMTDKDVRKAVTLPARQGGLTLEPGLVDDILRDLRGSARHRNGDGDGAYEAGRLPLLAHALRATWLRRDKNALTRGGYRRTGGIDGAVRASAETEFEKLSDGDRRTARQLFLSLVRIGEHGEVARRRRTRAELLRTTTAPEAVPGLVEQFTQARLLTQGVERGQATVEITHEALLTAWPQLRSWIRPETPGQTDVPLRQELEESAIAWLRGGRKDTASLYRGGRLELARSWAAHDGNEDLTELITDFLTASRRHERRTRLAWRGGVAVIVVLGLLASALAVFALDSRADALKQRDNAVFDRVTAEADRQRDTNGALASQLDLVAYRMRPTAALRTRLTEASGAVLPTALPGDFGVVHSVAYGPGGRLATGGDSLRLWNASDPTEPGLLGSPLKGRNGARVAAAYNPKGDLLAVSGGEGSLRVLDVSDAGRPVALSNWVRVSRGAVPVLRFSPDGRTLALVTTGVETDGVMTGTVQLWSVADPRRPRRLSTPYTVRGGGITSVAFSPDGDTLAVSGGTGPGSPRTHVLRLLNVSDPARPALLGNDLGGHTAIINQVAYSPVGSVMASAGSDNRVLIWDLSQPRRPKVVNRLFLDSPASAIAFSPDGRLLATGENSGNLFLFNAGAPDSTRALAPALRAHTSTITGLAFDRSGRTLASGSGDGRVLLWRLSPAFAVTADGNTVSRMALTGDGRLLAVASGNEVSLWDTSDPARLVFLGNLPRFLRNVNALAFRPAESGALRRAGQTVLATGSSDGDVRLWDVSAPAHPVQMGTALTGLKLPAVSVAFDSSGDVLIASAMQLKGGYTGGMRAWDVSDPAHPVAVDSSALREQRLPVWAMAAAPKDGYVYSGDFYGGRLHVWRTGKGGAPSIAGQADSGQIVYSLAAAPKAPFIATGNGDSTVRLWDVSRPSSPRSVGNPLFAGGIVNSVQFSPDGGLLASGNASGQIRLWDISDPARTKAYGVPLTGHRGSVLELRFSPRSGTLITGGADGTVRLWQTDPARARTLLCASTATAMTETQWKRYVSQDLPYDPPCGT